ncbi:bifunctional riboflavin kinase/FAD synthetase [Dissulfurimicrobium hydrothermale]|nr:bifunctional riboflavin kinase/FAD synthetase [Dissulfurimicrobium hydrothermale]UKL14600.1 bifunctional riboflavin kinase/FAD synthetase [Dissulfurimicrobium hydrothermale]
MKAYYSLDEISRPLDRPTLTIGNFDGVHLGHQALFRKVKELAASVSGDSVALTFEPHPLKVLRPDHPLLRICTLRHKIELIDRAGIGHLIILPFNKELAETSASDFVHEIFYRRLGIKNLVVGYDYALGKGREGDILFLRKAGVELGFAVHVLEPVVIEGVVVSSTKVRELVAAGDMRAVSRLLGRYYQIRGVVRPGRRRGGPLLGFPTANLRIDKGDLCPKSGVYVIQAIIGGYCYGGVLNIGRNPTFGDQEFGAEAHLFDFDEDIYGKEIKLNLIERLRNENRFSGPDELILQIKKDIHTARLMLAQEKGLYEACMEGIK